MAQISNVGADILFNESGQSGQASHRAQYRADIDGLRALAIVAVLVFHGFPKRLPGGFIGVDIFFVISGFLISRIILQDIDCGVFKFSGFYARRILRIFPALIVVLIGTLGLGWFVLFPHEYRQAAKHVVAGSTFVSNLVLWGETGYFDTAAQSKPLLHLWSLGIEEQFYLAWPLVLALLWKRPKRALAGVWTLAVVSFVANLMLVHKAPSAVFYSPFTRVWELLIGAVVARLDLDGKQVHSAVWSNCLAAVGASLIAIALLLLSEANAFPGSSALLPTIGTALLIGAGSRSWINKRLLSHPAAVWIGLISYPLYLWHWPLLVYLRLVLESDFTTSFAVSKLLRLAALLIAGGLAWATFRFCEVPLREMTRISRARKVTVLVVGLSAVCLLGGLSWAGIIRTRLVSPSIVAAIRAAEDWGGPPDQSLVGSESSTCSVHTIHSLRQEVTLFVGDSHIEQYWARAEDAMRRIPNPRSVVFATHNGCPPLPGLNQGYHPEYQCPKVYECWTALAKSPEVRVVVIGGYWEGDFLDPKGWLLNRAGERARPEDLEEAWSGLEATIASLVRSGKRVFILSSNPTSATFDPHRVLRRFGNSDIGQLQPIREADFRRYLAPIDQRLDAISTRTGAKVIRPVDYLCAANLCPATEADGTPMYRDTDHLRRATVLSRAGFIDDLLQAQ